jgi:hypothetical protein
MRHVVRSLTLVLFFMSLAFGQTLVISQAPDGGGWQFTLVLTNTTSTNAVVSIAFYQDIDSSGDTEAWTPPFVENVTLGAVTVPAASSVFLHSKGTAGTLTQGWAQISNAAGVEAYVIYTYTVGKSTQSATAEGVVSAARYLVPFDNTGTTGTELAVVNPNAASATVSINIKTSGGSTSTGSLNLPANGQMAFVLDNVVGATAGQSGLAEFYVTSGTLAMIALRSNTSAGGVFSFTTAPVYNETGSPIISTSGTGGGGGGGTGGGIPSGDITFAGFSIGETTNISSAGTTVTDSAGGVFAAYTAKAFNAPYSGTKIGSCVVYSVSYSPTQTYPNLPSLYLNAGNSLSLSGPSLPAADQTIPITNTPAGPVYVLSQVPSGTFQDGGTYTLSGTGGTQVEAFKVSATLPSKFSTNLASITTVNRSQPLTVTWMGTGFEGVIINVGSLVFSATNVDQTTITCLAPASAGTFSVPTEALAKLSATTPPAGIGTLSLATSASSSASISSQSALVTSFTPNLVSGGKMNYGAFAGSDSVSTSVTIQ